MKVLFPGAIKEVWFISRPYAKYDSWFVLWGETKCSCMKKAEDTQGKKWAELVKEGWECHKFIRE